MHQIDALVLLGNQLSCLVFPPLIHVNDPPKPIFEDNFGWFQFSASVGEDFHSPAKILQTKAFKLSQYSFKTDFDRKRLSELTERFIQQSQRTYCEDILPGHLHYSTETMRKAK